MYIKSYCTFKAIFLNYKRSAIKNIKDLYITTYNRTVVRQAKKSCEFDFRSVSDIFLFHMPTDSEVGSL